MLVISSYSMCQKKNHNADIAFKLELISFNRTQRKKYSRKWSGWVDLESQETERLFSLFMVADSVINHVAVTHLSLSSTVPPDVSSSTLIKPTQEPVMTSTVVWQIVMPRVKMFLYLWHKSLPDQAMTCEDWLPAWFDQQAAGITGRVCGGCLMAAPFGMVLHQFQRKVSVFAFHPLSFF